MLISAPGAWFNTLWSCRLASASPALQPQIVRLATISEGINTWPLYVAEKKDLFRKEGIAVEVTLTRSSAKQLEALKEGRFEIGFQQSDHIVRGVENGADLFILMALSHAPDLSLVAAPGVRAFTDLKGRVIAVDGARSGYAVLLRKILAERGLGDSDYVFQEIGGSQERYNAVKSGTAAASLLNPPFDRNLIAAGFGSLGTIRDYAPTYPGSIAATRRSWAARNEGSLIAFIRGCNAAYSWLQDPARKDEAIDILLARLDFKREAASRAFDRIAQSARPSISAESLQQVIDLVWEAEGFSGVKATSDKYMDLSYLRKAGR